MIIRNMVLSFDQTKKEHSDRVLEIVSTDSAAAKSVLAASWVRSYKTFHLAPDSHQTSRICDSIEFANATERSGRMMKVAEPILDRLFSTVKLSGFSTVLCDSNGVILQQRQCATDEESFEKSGFSIGADWSEQYQGTNGIGTCLAEKTSTTILKDQHFKTNHIGLSCFGAPVFASKGELLGVLDVTSCRDEIDAGLNALISQALSEATTQIELSYFCDEFADARIIRGHSDQANPASLLAVDAYDIVVGATRAARRQYGLSPAGDISPISAAEIVGDMESRGTGFESAERRELRRVLAKVNGNMTAAARELGVSRATIYRRATKLGLKCK